MTSTDEDETRRKTHGEIQNAVGDRGHLISQELLQVTFPITRLHRPRGPGECVEELGSKAGLRVGGKSRRDPRDDDL